MNKKYKSLAKNTLLFAIGSIGSKLILFLLVPLYTHYMEPTEYGVSDLVFTVGQILVPFLSAGVFAAVIRFGISKDAKAEDVLRNSLIVISIGSIAMLALSPIIGLYPSLSDWKWYLTAYVISDLYASVLTNYLKAKEQNKKYTIISLARTLVLALLNVVFLVFLRQGISGYLLSTILSNLFAVIAATFTGKVPKDIKESSKNKKLLKEMLLYSSPLILNGISWWIIHSSDKLMLEAMVGTAALGIYSVAGKIPSIINVIISIFSQAWDISSIKEVENDKDVNFFSGVFKIYSTGTFVITILALLAVKPFMGIYVGDSFSDAWQYVPLLIVGAAYNALGTFFGSFYGALKKSKLSMWSTLISAIVNIAVNFLLIPPLGIFGAVIGTVAAYVVMMIFRMTTVLHYIRVDFDKTKFAFNSVMILLCAIFISKGISPLIISAFTVPLYIITNYHELCELTKKASKITKRRIKK